jgi:hypothetical protein
MKFWYSAAGMVSKNPKVDIGDGERRCFGSEI